MEQTRQLRRSKKDDLDAVGSVPAAAANASVGGDTSCGGGCAGTAHIPEAEYGAGEPEDGGEKSECNISLPLLAGALLSNIAPVPDRSAIHGADELYIMLVK